MQGWPAPISAPIRKVFRQGTAAADADDRLIYQQSTGSLWYDPDGTGAQAQVLIALLSNKVALSADDFFIS